VRDDFDMDTERALRGCLAICLLFALGASADALDGAMSTESGDVVDVDYSELPVSEQQAADVREAVIGESDDESEGEHSARDRSAPASDADRQRPAGEVSENDQVEHGGSGGDGDGDRDQSGAPDSSSDSSDATDPSLLDRLRALLERLLPIAAVLGALGLLYAARDELLEPFSGTDGVDETATARQPPAADPGDPVSDAWYAMVRDLGLDGDVSKTPRECERQATAAGVDPGVVRSLTALYERTRYAGDPVTPERSQAARERLEAFRREYDEVTVA